MYCFPFPSVICLSANNRSYPRASYTRDMLVPVSALVPVCSARWSCGYVHSTSGQKTSVRCCWSKLIEQSSK